MEVYLDNSATTRVFPQVAELMTKIMCEDYGNPSSLHKKGVEAEQYLREARETLARIMKVSEKEILFTSGGTESDNMAASRLCESKQQKRKPHYHYPGGASCYLKYGSLSGIGRVSGDISSCG